MYSRLRAFISWRFSFLLLLVPYLNLIFVLLFFLLAPEKQLFKAVSIPFLGAIALYILNKALPEQAQWLIPILVTTAIAIAAFVFLRHHQNELYQPSRRRVLIIGVIATGLVVLGISIFGNMHRLGLREKTEIYLQAVIEEDNEKLHTVSYSQTIDAAKLAQTLRGDGILLDGPILVVKQDSFSSKTVNGTTTANATFQVSIGNAFYVVKVDYLADKTNAGIHSLTMTLAH